MSDNDMGIQKIYLVEPDSQIADVIFIHGLGGGGKDTWHPKDDEKNFWPLWLGEDIGQTGVWSLDYPADSTKWTLKGSGMDLSQRATNILEYLSDMGFGKKPLIFICHSLGGLLIKKILEKASTLENQKWNPVLDNTKGILFLATPHSGSSLASLAKAIRIYRPSKITQDLKADCRSLLDLGLWFSNQNDKLNIHVESLYETEPLKNLLGKEILVVPEERANPNCQKCVPIPCDGNHFTICKPKSKSAPVYVKAVSFIKTILDDISPTEKNSPAPFLIPFMQNSFLKNSERWTDRIREKFTTGYQVAVCQVAATGQGGIGKSAMAIEYAYRFAAEYPGGVFWLSMGNGLTGAAAIFLEMAENKGLIQDDWKEADEPIQVKLLISQLQKKGLKLIILDNLETGKVPVELAGIKDSHQLITTRNQAMAVQQVGMDLPDPDMAIDIFIGYANQDRAGMDEEDLGYVGSICETVEYLPLALEILGSLSRGYPLKKMAEELPGDLIQKERETCNKECTSVLASLDLAGQQFTQPRTRDVLCSIAYLDPDTIIPDLLVEILEIPEDKIYTILANLTDLSILKKTANGYGIHRLIQHALFFLDETIEWGETVLNHISRKINKINQTGDYISGYNLIPHILHIAQSATEEQPEDDFPNVKDLSNWSIYLQKAGNYYSTEPIVKSCLKRRENAKGPDHPHVATMLNNLAEVYRSQGKYEDAEPLCTRALKIRETVLGPDHPDLSVTLNNLALLYYSQGKYEEAEPLYTRALKITETVLGPDHPAIATTLNNLAWLYYSQGKYEEAEPLYTRDLKITETVLGPDHPDIATTLNNLALLYQSQGKYEQAEPLYTRALRIIETVLGPDHPDIANTLNNLAGLYESQGKDEEAEPLYTRALKIKETVLGPEHPDIATTLNNLAGLYYSQEKYEEAEPLYTRALKIRENVLGPDHPNTKTVRNNFEALVKKRKNC
jgi:tetratricopeptide (TPR) repeat protein